MKVPLLGRATTEVLEKLGICSINDLSLLSEEDCVILARKLKSLSDGLAENGYLKARLIMACRYAKAIRRGKPLVYGYNPLVDNLAKHYKEKKLVFFDLEYDPAKPLIFIIGVMSANGEVTQFFIENEEKEKVALIKLADIISNRLLVCYAGKSADIPTLRKCYRKHGLLMPRIQLVDLFYDILFTQKLKTQVIYLPLTHLSEKTVANYLGYKPPENLEIKDGLLALIYFYNYIKERDTKRKEKIKEQLLLYNRCDLERAKFILEKIFELFQVK